MTYIFPDMIRVFAGLFIFFGSALAFMVAVSYLVRKQKTAAHYISAILFFALGFLLFEHFFTRYLVDFPRFSYKAGYSVFFHFCRFLRFMIGPLLWLLIQSLIIRHFSFTAKNLVHFAPVVLAELFCLCGPVLFSLFPGRKSTVILVYDILNVSSFLHMIIYTITTLIRVLHLFMIFPAKTRRQLTIPGFLTAYSLLVICFSATEVLLGKSVLETGSLFALSGLVIIMFLINQRQPDLLNTFSRDLKTAKYKRSLLKKHDTQIIHDRLMQLMEDEKIFIDEDLTLKDLARHMSLTQHQMSEFLNNNLQTGFNTFINRYRTEEAKRLLIEQKDRPVLNIAYSAGFNSKTVFYTIFSEQTGLTPSQYRNRYLDNS